MLKIGPNLNKNMLFILVNVQNRIVLMNLGESAKRISERIIDHGGRDLKSNLFRHAVVNEHCNASYDDFKIIGSGFKNNTFKRKVAKALLVNLLGEVG